MIPYGSQHIEQADIDAVIEVLRSDFLTQGPAAGQFERALAAYCGLAEGVAFNSATSALHCACLALGVDSESRVWVPAISFVASANCAEYCGAQVNFIDVEPDTGNLCMEDLERRLRLADRRGELPELVVAVHYAGHLCDMAQLRRLANQFDFKILEDASHALGALPPAHWEGEQVGDIRVYSFHPVKMITTAEGGMALTDCAELAHRMRLAGNHGIERQAQNFVSPADGAWYYEQQSLGYNYRMSDLQAALGLSQLRQLDGFLTQRRRIAQRYMDTLDSVTPLIQNRNGLSSYHLFSVLADETRYVEQFQRLREAGIGVQKHYIPIPNQPYYREKYAYQRHDFPAAQTFYQRELSLPIFPDLTEQQQDKVIACVNELL